MELALQFEAKGMGWVYGTTPTVVLTSRALTSTRDTVTFFDGDVADLLARPREQHRGIWVVGGGAVCGDVLRRGLADEVRYSIVPIAIGDGVPFFAGLDRDVAAPHLVESTAHRNGTGRAALRGEGHGWGVSTRAMAKKTSKTPVTGAARAATSAKAARPTAKRAKVRLLSGGNPQIAKAVATPPCRPMSRPCRGGKRDVGRRLDALITRTIPRVQKAVKWNSPFYGLAGKAGW